MRHNWTLRRQANASASRAEAREECEGGILYLDEQHLTRDCIGRELARRLPEFKIIERATAREYAESDPSFAKIVLVIVYVHPDRMDLHAGREDSGQSGVAAQLSALEELAPETPRVLMSEAEVGEDILEAFRRRVRGYIPTTLPIKQVAEAIRFVAAGGTFVPPSILSIHGRPSAVHDTSAAPLIVGELADFSPRQNEVLRMLWNGSSNKVIAYELRMSESTVKVHIRHIMKKLNVNNRTQVVLRTRPKQLENEFLPNRVAPPPALSAPKASGPLVPNRPILGQAVARSIDLSKEVGLNNTSHRS
jgi:DNA-binding NarL/FixJ family response regulator